MFLAAASALKLTSNTAAIKFGAAADVDLYRASSSLLAIRRGRVERATTALVEAFHEGGVLGELAFGPSRPRLIDRRCSGRASQHPRQRSPHWRLHEWSRSYQPLCKQCGRVSVR